MAERRLPFVQVDVFTQKRFEGNQLAVFTDARGLTDAEMQSIALEMNLSETTFIFPENGNSRAQSEYGARVRIFTVKEELPFAGHPTLGTAWYLAQREGASVVTLDLKVGKIPVRFERREEYLYGEMRQTEPTFGAVLPHSEVAGALGLPVAELDENLPIQTVSTGVPFTIVPFRSLATLQDIKISWSQIAAYLAKLNHAGFLYFVCRHTVHREATLHARMFFYNGEDPATGSAAGCCTAWAVNHGVLASDQQGMIEQGVEIKRTSHIYIRATRKGDGVTNVRVGGYVVHVVDGTVTM